MMRFRPLLSISSQPTWKVTNQLNQPRFYMIRSLFGSNILGLFLPISKMLSKYIDPLSELTKKQRGCPKVIVHFRISSLFLMVDELHPLFYFPVNLQIVNRPVISRSSVLNDSHKSGIHRSKPDIRYLLSDTRRNRLSYRIIITR